MSTWLETGRAYECFALPAKNALAGCNLIRASSATLNDLLLPTYVTG